MRKRGRELYFALRFWHRAMVSGYGTGRKHLHEPLSLDRCATLREELVGYAYLYVVNLLPIRRGATATSLLWNVFSTWHPYRNPEEQFVLCRYRQYPVLVGGGDLHNSVADTASQRNPNVGVGIAWEVHGF